MRYSKIVQQLVPRPAVTPLDKTKPAPCVVLKGVHVRRGTFRLSMLLELSTVSREASVLVFIMAKSINLAIKSTRIVNYGE
jgi:hypothetical protein